MVLLDVGYTTITSSNPSLPNPSLFDLYCHWRLSVPLCFSHINSLSHPLPQHTYPRSRLLCRKVSLNILWLLILLLSLCLYLTSLLPLFLVSCHVVHILLTLITPFAASTFIFLTITSIHLLQISELVIKVTFIPVLTRFLSNTILVTSVRISFTMWSDFHYSVCSILVHPLQILSF